VVLDARFMVDGIEDYFNRFIQVSTTSISTEKGI